MHVFFRIAFAFLSNPKRKPDIQKLFISWVSIWPLKFWNQDYENHSTTKTLDCNINLSQANLPSFKTIESSGFYKEGSFRQKPWLMSVSQERVLSLPVEGKKKASKTEPAASAKGQLWSQFQLKSAELRCCWLFFSGFAGEKWWRSLRSQLILDFFVLGLFRAFHAWAKIFCHKTFQLPWDIAGHVLVTTGRMQVLLVHTCTSFKRNGKYT